VSCSKSNFPCVACNRDLSSRFSDEPLVASVGLEVNVTTGEGENRVTRKAQLKPLTNGDFIPKTLVGVCLGLIDKIDVLLFNQVSRRRSEENSACSNASPS